MQQAQYRYVTQLHNVESQIGAFEVSKGVMVSPLDEQFLEILSNRGRDTRVYNPWENRTAWFLVAEHQNDPTQWINGNPSEAARVFRQVLLIHFGERAHMGGCVHFKLGTPKPSIRSIGFDASAQREPIGAPDEYLIGPSDVPLLQSLFSALTKYRQLPLLLIPLSWFSKACAESTSPDAVLDLSIALEALYIDSNLDKRKREKAEPIAERGAVFAEDKANSAQDVYVQLRSFYKARNKIVHEGEEHPLVNTKPGRQYDIEEIKRDAFRHSRLIFDKLLQGVPPSKQAFVQDLDTKSKRRTQEFQGYLNHHFA